MDLFFGIISIVASFLLIFILFIINKEDKDVIPSAILGSFSVVCFIIGIGVIVEYYSPSITPIDVYRGRTTLEITYRDGVAIDSTVVWKEEVK